MSRIIDYMRELDLVSSEKIKRYFMKNKNNYCSYLLYHKFKNSSSLEASVRIERTITVLQTVLLST